MKIDHIALWVNDLEVMRQFYEKYFDATSNNLYENKVKHYTSYFLSFGEGLTRLEIMNRPDIEEATGPRGMKQGWAHLSISVDSRVKMLALTERLRNDGFTIAGEPRTTGDGYFESIVLDPEGNMVEIVA